MHEIMGSHWKVEYGSIPDHLFPCLSFLPSIHTYLLNTYCVPGTVLSAGNTAVTKDRSSAPQSLHLIGSHTVTKNYTFQELVFCWFNFSSLKIKRIHQGRFKDY